MWVHQAIAAEHKFLKMLLGINVGALPRNVADEWFGKLLDATVVGLCGRGAHACTRLCISCSYTRSLFYSHWRVS